ncbi:MAG: hypothetical protein M0C28_40560 [Candidatus Moduliflexus flocculans]|nr:hypothetical protein [Candidatus Moduliflexus flocculans]
MGLPLREQAGRHHRPGQGAGRRRAGRTSIRSGCPAGEADRRHGGGRRVLRGVGGVRPGQDLVPAVRAHPVPARPGEPLYGPGRAARRAGPAHAPRSTRSISRRWSSGPRRTSTPSSSPTTGAARTRCSSRPALWREMFKPLYRDYVEIAHRHGKYAFMHSDGHIAAILPDLVEIGLDALNAQLFTMDVDGDRPASSPGSSTFWGEVDRQHLLPYGSAGGASRRRCGGSGRALWREGGVIAQCEFGIGARPENVAAVFDAWDRCRLDRNVL